MYEPSVTPLQLKLHKERLERQAGFAAAAKRIEVRCQTDREQPKAVEKIVWEEKSKSLELTNSLKVHDALEQTNVLPQEPEKLTIEKIKRVVALHYGISHADLVSKKRTADVVLPRQVAMYLARTLILRSMPEIARLFGGWDHTTVIHAVRKIERLTKDGWGKNENLAKNIEVLKQELQPD